MQTPWGQSDCQYHVAGGIVSYSTPSHGGYHLSAARQKQLHASAHVNNSYNGPAWWEEDCDWAVVFLSFPNEFQAYYERMGDPHFEANRASALRTVESYHPAFFAYLAEPLPTASLSKLAASAVASTQPTLFAE